MRGGPRLPLRCVGCWGGECADRRDDEGAVVCAVHRRAAEFSEACLVEGHFAGLGGVDFGGEGFDAGEGVVVEAAEPGGHVVGRPQLVTENALLDDEGEAAP